MNAEVVRSYPSTIERIGTRHMKFQIHVGRHLQDVGPGKRGSIANFREESSHDGAEGIVSKYYTFPKYCTKICTILIFCCNFKRMHSCFFGC